MAADRPALDLAGLRRMLESARAAAADFRMSEECRVRLDDTVRGEGGSGLFLRLVQTQTAFDDALRNAAPALLDEVEALRERCRGPVDPMLSDARDGMFAAREEARIAVLERENARLTAERDTLESRRALAMETAIARLDVARAIEVGRDAARAEAADLRARLERSEAGAATVSNALWKALNFLTEAGDLHTEECAARRPRPEEQQDETDDDGLSRCDCRARDWYAALASDAGADLAAAVREVLEAHDEFSAAMDAHFGGDEDDRTPETRARIQAARDRRNAAQWRLRAAWGQR